MSRTYNLSKISCLLSYTIEDICDLYSNNRLHPQTVRKWIKQGLVTIDSGRPVLIHGSDLIVFLKRINEKHHTNLKFDEFYCVTCKEAHIPLHKTVYLEQGEHFIKAKGLCPKTKKIMNKSYKMAAYAELKKNFNLESMSRLYDLSDYTCSTHMATNDIKMGNESTFKQENLYDE